MLETRVGTQVHRNRGNAARGCLVEPSAEFSVSVSCEGADRVVMLAGEVDMATAPQFAAAVASLCTSDARLVFDLRAVTFMDSSGLSVIATSLARLGPDGGTACVRGASPLIRRTIEI